MEIGTPTHLEALNQLLDSKPLNSTCQSHYLIFLWIARIFVGLPREKDVNVHDGTFEGEILNLKLDFRTLVVIEENRLSVQY